MHNIYKIYVKSNYFYYFITRLKIKNLMIFKIYIYMYTYSKVCIIQSGQISFLVLTIKFNLQYL